MLSSTPAENLERFESGGAIWDAFDRFKNGGNYGNKTTIAPDAVAAIVASWNSEAKRNRVTDDIFGSQSA